MSGAEHTPLPWSSEPNGEAFNLKSPDRAEHVCILLGMVGQPEGEHAANVALLIESVNAAPATLAELEAARVEIARLKAYHDRSVAMLGGTMEAAQAEVERLKALAHLPDCDALAEQEPGDTGPKPCNCLPAQLVAAEARVAELEALLGRALDDVQWAPNSKLHADITAALPQGQEGSHDG